MSGPGRASINGTPLGNVVGEPGGTKVYRVVLTATGLDGGATRRIPALLAATPNRRRAVWEITVKFQELTGEKYEGDWEAPLGPPLTGPELVRIVRTVYERCTGVTAFEVPKLGGER